MRRWLALGLSALAIAAAAQPAPRVEYEQVWIPAKTSSFFGDQKAIKLEATLYKPKGDGPFPLLLFSHGSTGGVIPATRTLRPSWLADLALERGFVVLAPMRRGRGASEGSYDESYQCDYGVQDAGVRNAIEDTDAALAYARTLPFVDASRVVLAGASRGGILSTIYAMRRPGVALGVVNFVGGWHGAQCHTGFNSTMFAEAGKAAKTPALWLYAENDRYYLPATVQGYAKAYADAGAKMQLRIFPSEGKDGHGFYFRSQEWKKDLGEFLDALGFPRKP
jgi:dienelactone hydrolase